MGAGIQGCNAFLSTIKSDAELLKTRVEFAKWGHEMDEPGYLHGLGNAGCWMKANTNH